MQLASRYTIWPDAVRRDETVLVIRTDPGRMYAELACGALAQGSRYVTVDWGDGTVERLDGIDGAVHLYPWAKEYTIRISNDLKSFGYTQNEATAAIKDMLLEVVSLGSKVTEITEYAFNNCHNLRGVLDFPHVTEIGDYAFGSTIALEEFILPSMSALRGEQFYIASGAAALYVDNVKSIPKLFWIFYGENLTDMYIRGKSAAEIAAMANFPFRAEGGVRFHGSDGIVLADGTIIPNT